MHAFSFCVSVYLLLDVTAGAGVYIPHACRGTCGFLKEWCRLCAGICRYGWSTACLPPSFLLLPPPISISSSHPHPHLLLPCLPPFFLLAPSSRLPYISVSSLPPVFLSLFGLTHWTEVALLPCTVIGCLPDAGWAKQHSGRAAGADGPQCTTAHHIPSSSFIPPSPPPSPRQPATFSHNPVLCLCLAASPPPLILSQ